MNVVGATKDLYLIQNAVCFVSIIKWHITLYISKHKKGIKIATIGAKGYPDYPTLKKTKGKKFADVRRKLYKARHINNRKIKNSAGYYADQLLW